MLPFKKIFCPTDFSDPSLEALAAAVEMASHFNSELYLLHVVAPVPRPTWTTQFYPAPEAYAVEFADYEQSLRESAERKLTEILEKEAGSRLQTHALVGEGDAASEIVRLAEREQADLIMIATHGLTGWRHLIHGSVTERVLRLSTCPVLTVHALPAKQDEDAK